MSPRRPLIALVLIGLGSRVALAPFTGHGWDMYVWFKSAELFSSGNMDIYSISELGGFPWGFYSYPPPWLYWLALSHRFYEAFTLPLEGYVFLIKLPIIASDIVIGLLIYMIAGLLGLGGRKRVYLTAAYLLNPLPIFISGIWGMFDSLACVFVLLSLYLMMRGRVSLAGLSIGMGMAVKIFPVFLLPVTIAHLLSTQRGLASVVKRHLLPSLAPLAIASAPFLYDLDSYLGKLFFHTTQIGQFSYWTLISPLTGPQLVPPISWSAFAAFVTLLLRRHRGSLGKCEVLVTLYAGMLVIFMATSSKVNVQYLLWVLPLLLLDIGKTWRWRSEDAVSLLIVNGAALIFIAGTFGIIGYTLDSLGKINVLSTRGGLSVFLSALLPVTAGLAGWRFMLLMLSYCRVRGISRFLSERTGAVALVVVLAISVTLFPNPSGIRLGNSEPRIVVVDSPESLFTPLDPHPERILAENLASPTHIVIPFAPDFYNTYTLPRPNAPIDKYLRFDLDTTEWTQGELRALVLRLRSAGFKVLAGLYTSPRQVLISYGIHGYESEWITRYHPYILDGGRIRFDAELRPDGLYVSERTRYADFLAGRIERVIEDFGFGGVYILTGPEGITTTRDIEWIEPLLVALRERLDERRLIIVDEVDPYLGPEGVGRAARIPDYVVLHTSPWIDGVNHPMSSNRTMEDYAARLNEINARIDETYRQKLLYSVYVMDMTAGWLLPALQTQLEVDNLGSRLGTGYAIYYGSRYLPYKLTVGPLRPAS